MEFEETQYVIVENKKMPDGRTRWVGHLKYPHKVHLFPTRQAAEEECTADQRVVRVKLTVSARSIQE